MSNICAGRERSNGSFDSHIALRRKMHDFMLIFKDIEGVTVFSVPTIRSFKLQVLF
jgi:hypothetical protein